MYMYFVRHRAVAQPSLVNIHVAALQDIACMNPIPHDLQDLEAHTNGEAGSHIVSATTSLVPADITSIHHCARQLFDAKAIVGTHELSILDMQNVSVATVEFMRRSGLVSVRIDEFGDSMIAVHPHAIRWKVATG